MKDRISVFFFFSSRRRHTSCSRDWSSDVCSSDLAGRAPDRPPQPHKCPQRPARSSRFPVGQPCRRHHDRNETVGGEVAVPPTAAATDIVVSLNKTKESPT